MWKVATLVVAALDDEVDRLLLNAGPDDRQDIQDLLDSATTHRLGRRCMGPTDYKWFDTKDWVIKHVKQMMIEGA